MEERKVMRSVLGELRGLGLRGSGYYLEYLLNLSGEMI